MTIVFQQLTGEQEARAFLDEETKAKQAAPAAGEPNYVVSNKWFSQWCQYSGFEWNHSRGKPRLVSLEQPGPRPGPIDNADLLAPHPASSDLTAEQAAEVQVLREGLVDKRDLWLVSEVTWKMLKEWYGVAGPEIRREHHSVGRGRVELDVSQQHFRVVLQDGGGSGGGMANGNGAGPGQRECVVGASAMCQLLNLKAMACQQLGVDPEQHEIYDFKGGSKGDCLEPVIFKTLTGSKLADHQALLLLPKMATPVKAPAAGSSAAAAPASPNGNATSGPVLILPPGPGFISTSPRRPLSSPRFGGPTSPLSRSFDRAPAWAEDVVVTAHNREHGLAGLGNLGNTCFMNSSLQCLAHSWPLMQAFLSGTYKADLNRDNPLSLGGKLALAFGSLMDKLWRGGVGHVSPKLFKWQLAKFAPQFSGYAQQDSQELLAFLLDGLHEDLNRITDKPYVEDKDSDGRPDEELAAEAWHNYKRRNDSVIVDSFQYLCRSKLTCPHCAFTSIKFDPLMYLTLPLPSSKKRSLAFTVVHMDGSVPPKQYAIELPKSATVGQLYVGIAELAGLATESPEQVLLLTQANMSGGDGGFVVYDDVKARLSSLEDFRPRSVYFRPAAPTSLYTAWVYPSPDQGPLSGKQALHVFHRQRGGVSTAGYVLPPTPLFLDRSELEAMAASAQEEKYSEHSMQASPGLSAALTALLRPLRRDAEPETGATGTAPGADAACSMADDSDQQQQQQQQQQQEQTGEAGDGAPAPMDASTPPSVAAGDAEAGAGAVTSSGPGSEMGEAMEVEQPQQEQEPDQQQEQQQEEQQQQAAPNGDASWLSGVGSAASQPGGSSAGETGDNGVFDMWAAQKEEAAQAAAAAAAAASSRPLYVLRPAKRASYGNSLTCYQAKWEVPQEPGEPLLLVAEWQEAAGALYDPAPMVTSPEQDPSAVALAERSRDGGKSVTLADCLETFLEEEQLGADESWYCGKCKEHVQADKKLDLWSLPDVLVILLQRFSHSRYSRDKLDTLVDFPLKGLDMGPYLLSHQQQSQAGGAAGPAPVYDLYAVSNHYGSMGGGHYTAYARMPGDAESSSEGRWFTFDDSHVSRMEGSGVATKAAYVLFYKRQGAQEDLSALLQQHAAVRVQEASGGSSGSAGGGGGLLFTPMAGSPPAPPAEQQQQQQPLGAASPPVPPPLPAMPGTSGSGGSALGKRQPETIDEEAGEEEGEVGMEEETPAAGAIEID